VAFGTGGARLETRHDRLAAARQQLRPHGGRRTPTTANATRQRPTAGTRARWSRHRRARNRSTAGSFFWSPRIR